MRGEMLWFNEVKNFGFIRTEEGERLYVHRDGFVPGHAPVGSCVGLVVLFEVEEGAEQRQAVGVTVPNDVPARRARRRRHGVS